MPFSGTNIQHETPVANALLLRNSEPSHSSGQPCAVRAVPLGQAGMPDAERMADHPLAWVA
jgi:hypothetical protein